MKTVARVLFGVLLANSVNQRSGTGTIDVGITDTTEGHLVHATAQVLETRQGAYTNSDGVARLMNVKPGSYTVVCTYIGHYPDTVPNVRVDSGKTTHLDVVLHERRVY